MLLVTGEGLRGRRERALRRRLATIVAPVELRRYGVLRSGVVFRWCQRIATRRLAGRIRALATAETGPDIVAHSFGAWLVGQALRQHPELRVGRVILIGSVLRPDFDWGALVASGRVEAVLNEYGLRDYWVWASEYVIPDSGPAGLRGCAGVLNHAHPAFGHADFFDEPAIDDINRALWTPFLTLPTAKLAQLANVATVRAWSPAPWPLRATLPRLAVVVATAAGIAGLLWLARWLVGVLW